MPLDAQTIFDDLRTLAQMDGALHSISSMIYRDFRLRIDAKDGKVLNSEDDRWSKLKLNNNELSLLLGLTVQSTSDRIYTILPSDNVFAAKADKLLRMFHDSLIKDSIEQSNFSGGVLTPGPNLLGAVAREAIYYGADSFYVQHFEKFSRYRYREDVNWLLTNVGFSIRPMLDIARHIARQINFQMTHVGTVQDCKVPESAGHLTNGLLISKDELVMKFGQKAYPFFSKFSTPVVGANNKFVSPFTINQVNIAPLIDLGDHLYVSNQYLLFQSIYESPFYWMMDDSSYKDIHAEHRGAFLEKTSAQILESVFDTENVYQNVTIHRSNKEIAGEADLLVVYGEFILVVQAKSKRITQKARAGDIDALRTDFGKAVQEPYIQARKFGELVREGQECVTKTGKTMTFPSTSRIFPCVILSDAFPAVTHLSGALLDYNRENSPVIWDLGQLDCFAKILPTPIDFIYYLKSRSDTFNSVLTDSEYNLLGFHLKCTLALPQDVNGMVIENEFATAVDDYMIADHLGIDRPRPTGIHQRLDIPVVSLLINYLRNVPPELASIVIDLYSFSGAALQNISNLVISLREEVTKGKEFKAFSIPTDGGGLTYVVCKTIREEALESAYHIGTKHKYDCGCDRWFVIVDCIQTSNPVDTLLPITGQWKKDAELAKHSRSVGKLFNSERREIPKREVWENADEAGKGNRDS